MSVIQRRARLAELCETLFERWPMCDNPFEPCASFESRDYWWFCVAEFAVAGDQDAMHEMRSESDCPEEVREYYRLAMDLSL